MLVQLKQLIGHLVHELDDLGLSPETLRQVISTVESSGNTISDMGLSDHRLMLAAHSDSDSEQTFFPPVKSPQGNTVPQQVAYSKIFYEVISESGKSFPQLRVCMNSASEYATRKVVPHPKLEEATRETNGCVTFQVLQIY